jgi:MraZ protein
MELQQRSDQPAILTADLNCLRLYPYTDWCDIETAIVSQAALLDPEVQDVARVRISGAVEAPIDNQGRILVPQYLREHAHLDRDVTLAGVGRTVELWDAARFKENLEQTQLNFRALSRDLAQKLRS